MKLSPATTASILATPDVQIGPQRRTLAEPPATVRFAITAKIVSEMNAREHWAARLRRKKSQQEATYYAMYEAGINCAWYAAKRLTITLSRVSNKRFDDDNYAGAFKHIRDAIARAIGQDDGSERLTWRYEQHTGKADGLVWVEIEAVT